MDGLLATPGAEFLELDLAFGGLPVFAGIVITPATDGALEPY